MLPVGVGVFAATNLPLVAGTNTYTAVITDPFGRLATSVVATLVQGRGYGYDGNGNMTNDGVFAYVWDNADRLAEVRRGTQVVMTCRYDGAGRRRERIVAAGVEGGPSTNRYVYQDWLVLEVRDGGNAVLESYTHGPDLSGLLAGAGGIGGILSCSTGGTNRWFHYDGNGNVVRVTDGGRGVVAVLDGAGQLVEYYTRGSGLAGDVGTIVAETKFAGGAATNTYYYHNNHRGDIVAVRSTNGTTLGMWDYRPFGEDRTAAGGVRPRFGFSSKEMDQASGTHYFGYRHYSRNLGRWLCNDPIGISGGLNQYVFCSNNPVNFSDPLGLCEEQPWEVEKTRLIDEARRWNRTSPRWAFREYECSAQAMRLREHLVSTVHPQYWMLNILGGARFGVEGTRFTYWNHNIVWASPWPMSPGRSQQRDFTIDAFKGSRWFFQDPNANGDVWISTLEEFRRIYPIDLSR